MNAKTNSPVIRRLVVPDELGGQRLDRVLATLAGDFSRTRIQALVRAGHVRSERAGTRLDPSEKVAAGDVLVVVEPEPEPARPLPEAFDLTIAFEDEHLIVVDKPAGLVVHPAAGHSSGTLVNALLAHCGASLSGIGGVKRPGIVHRLDKDTSGLLVVAKSDAAHQGLSAQFASHGADGQLERQYTAIVWGGLSRPRMTVDAALARSPHHRTRMAISKSAQARRAVTHVEVAETYLGSGGRSAIVASLVRVGLETGRTHQIRVHMAHVGNPVLGDATYGGGFQTRAKHLSGAAQAALTSLGRQALHASRLGFVHPATGKPMSFASPMPGDIARLIDQLRIKSAGEP